MLRTAVRKLSALRSQVAGVPQPPVVFSSVPTVRPIDAYLDDPAWVENAAKEASAVLMVNLDTSAVGVNAAGQLAWASEQQAREVLGAEDTVLLGRRPPSALPPSFLNERYAKAASDVWVYAASVSAEGVSQLSGVSLCSLRELPSRCAPGEAAMAGQARNLLLWHRSSRFCGSCGGVTVIQRVGWQRACTACGTPHFPRTDPVVISAVLSADGRRVLLGRQAQWPPGRFSCLAGFIDPGDLSRCSHMHAFGTCMSIPVT